MIITAPTGLYKPILPKSPSDSGNYTFTISSLPPPKSGQTFIQIPLPEVIRKQPDRVFSKLQKREFLGELVFDVTIPGPPTTGGGTAQFEIGQVVPFSEEGSKKSVDPYVLKIEELRQDLKVIDYVSAGMSKQQYLELKEKSESRFGEITAEISEVSSGLNSNKSSISSIQAVINNAFSLYENIIVVLGDDSSQAITVKNTLEDLNEKKDNLILERDVLESSLEALRNELQKVREVVR